MKLSKNLTTSRFILTIVLLLVLIIPWYQIGIHFPIISVAGKIMLNSKYLLSGLLFITCTALYFFLWQVKRKNKIMNQRNDNLSEVTSVILRDGLLIILAYNGFISVIIPITLMIRDHLVESMKKLSVDNGKMLEKSKLGMMQSICMFLGILLLLFYNLPFELWNIYLADGFVIIGTILSVITGMMYYFQAKKLIKKIK